MPICYRYDQLSQKRLKPKVEKLPFPEPWEQLGVTKAAYYASEPWKAMGCSEAAHYQRLVKARQAWYAQQDEEQP